MPRSEGVNGGERRTSRRRLRLFLFAIAAALVTALVIAGYATSVLGEPERDTIDTRFSIRGTDPRPSNLVVVEVNDETFDDLNKRWPFSRRIHAEAVRQLSKAGAKTIAYDVQFTEPSDDPDADSALVDAVDRAHGVVLATTEVDAKGRSNVFGGESVLRDIGARSGNASYATDSGGVIRRMPYEVEKLKGFAVTAAEDASGKTIRRSDLGGKSAWIDWSGPPGNLRTISFSRLVHGTFPPDLFRGKIVVVGASAPSLQDVHATAVSGSDLMPGPEVQAESILTALGGFPLSEIPDWVDILLIVLFAVLGPLITLRFGPLRAVLFGVIAGVVFAVAVQLAFNGGKIIAFLYPLSSLALGLVAALAIALVLDAFERERIRDIFSRFVPPEVVDEVLAKTDEDLRLGGEKREVTVLFSDIRGFTTFSETRPPEVVIEVLNRYLGAMTDIIRRHQGTLVAFMGDGIMAVFGAPLEMPDHADRALSVAREMTGSGLDEFNEWMRGSGNGDGFRIGVGLNSGAVMAGNVGSEERMEYTVIGDTTNTASRLEGLTKGTPHMIFLADTTRKQLSGDPDDVVHVDEMEVRGREEKVVIWSVK